MDDKFQKKLDQSLSEVFEKTDAWKDEDFYEIKKEKHFFIEKNEHIKSCWVVPFVFRIGNRMSRFSVKPPLELQGEVILPKSVIVRKAGFELNLWILNEFKKTCRQVKCRYAQKVFDEHQEKMQKIVDALNEESATLTEWGGYGY